MIATHPTTCGRDLKVEGVFSRSNLGRWHVDGWLTVLDRAAVARWHQGRRWQRLTGLECRACYGIQNSTRFTPTGSQQDGDFVRVTLKRRQEESSSSGGSSISATLVSVEGLLRSTFPNGNWTQSLPANSSYLDSLQLHHRSGRLI
jgi:hypothetical protein